MKPRSSEIIHRIFNESYIGEQATFIDNYQLDRQANKDRLQAKVITTTEEITIDGQGKGVLDAFVRGLSCATNNEIVLIDYNEHAMPNKKGAQNEQSEAIAYVQLSIKGARYCAAAKSSDIVNASLQAVLNAVIKSDTTFQKQSALKLA